LLLVITIAPPSDPAMFLKKVQFEKLKFAAVAPVD